NPEYCAADLLAQSEHDDLSQAILITPSRKLASEVVNALESQLKQLTRQAILKKSLNDNCIIAVTGNIDEAIDLLNLYAPEHALILTRPNTAYEERIVNAGCIIYGNKATVPMSDYVSGPSHSLPTEGTARFASALNVTDFVKITNLSSVGDALMNLAGEAGIMMARAEGLDAHANAMELRLKKTKKKK
ncbi:MAG: histidinol dehydrogenase, partial [Dehalococcoidales bacterium]|nr:histidinol dehydrogenase [Dehalococcoidales bacterium]